MKRWMIWGCLICVLGAASFAVAETPFAGTWKLNPAKSHLTGRTLRFASAGSGTIREATAEGSYTFKTDGQSYPAMFGESVNWKTTGANTWQSQVHGNGQLLVTNTWTLSPDGRMLTVVSEGTNPDGSRFSDSEVYKRVTAGKTLMGTWKSTAVKDSSEEMLEFAAYGDDGLTWKLPQIKATLNAKFDGKDYAPEGPTVPKGLTLALTKTGPRSFNLVEKMNGKPMYKGIYRISADGKTLTEVGSPTGRSEPTRSVYDKQG